MIAVDPLEALLHRTGAIYTALDMNFGDVADEAKFAKSAFSEVRLQDAAQSRPRWRRMFGR
jgi:hypothetical protein